MYLPSLKNFGMSTYAAANFEGDDVCEVSVPGANTDMTSQNTDTHYILRATRAHGTSTIIS